MKFLLNKEEEKKLIALFEQYDNNDAYYDYLYDINYEDDAFRKKKERALKKGQTPLEKKNLLFDFLEKAHPIKNEFVKKTIRWETQVLTAKHFEANPYFKALKSISFNDNGYRLETPVVHAYYVFSYGDEYNYGANYAINMSLAVLDEDLTYPAIYKDGLENLWLTPNEIREMEVPIALAKGDVLTLGLDIGYYAYMVSLKEEVKNVYIVEADQKLVDIFIKYILPLFPYPEKIHIIRAHPYMFYDTIEDNDYDCIFANFFNGVTYGAATYIEVKRYFSKFKYTQCSYMIENSIITHLRWLVIGVMKDEYYHTFDNRNHIEDYIASSLEDYEIKSSDDIDSLLNLQGLSELFLNF